MKILSMSMAFHFIYYSKSLVTDHFNSYKYRKTDIILKFNVNVVQPFPIILKRFLLV